MPQLISRKTSGKAPNPAGMGIPRRIYYEWVIQEKAGDKRSASRRPWNKTMDEEKKTVIDHARALLIH